MRMDSEGDFKNFEVSAGTIIFVPTRVRHSFYDIHERLAVLVFFGPGQDKAHDSQFRLTPSFLIMRSNLAMLLNL